MTTQVPHVPLGSCGLSSPRIALGTMGMTAFYNTDPGATEEESLRTLAAALDLGVNHLDTAWVYFNQGTAHHNEELVGKALAAHGRERFTVATKFFPPIMNGGAIEANIRTQLTESLRRLGTSYVDLYYMHRVCDKVPVEEVAATMNKLKAEGQIRFVGLSECTPSELQRFHAVCPVTCVQMEYSLGCRDIERDVLPCARTLGVAVVAYSPLARGLLAGVNLKDLHPNDWRHCLPRHSADNMSANAALVDAVTTMALSKGCTPAQISIAWLLAQGCDIVPLVGTKTVARLAENVAAASVSLSAQEVAALSSLPQLRGDRYPEQLHASSYNARMPSV